MTYLLVAALVAAITALTIDAVYSLTYWLGGHALHPFQRPHRFRRYAWIVTLISTETAIAATLLLVLAQIVAAEMTA